jgi:hypothetical protein
MNGRVRIAVDYVLDDRPFNAAWRNHSVSPEANRNQGQPYSLIDRIKRSHEQDQRTVGESLYRPTEGPARRDEVNRLQQLWRLIVNDNETPTIAASRKVEAESVKRQTISKEIIQASQTHKPGPLLGYIQGQGKRRESS